MVAVVVHKDHSRIEEESFIREGSGSGGAQAVLRGEWWWWWRTEWEPEGVGRAPPR
eukprot:SAG11_NODE_32036_length_287_cov_0.494681_1_plen_55_part_01